MIVTVTVNPCVDRSVSVARLVQGGSNSIKSVRIDYAGKGINCAKGVAALGKEVVATGFMYEHDRVTAERAVADEGVTADFVVCPGRLRVNTKVFDEEKREVTELNERGCPVTEEDVMRICEKVNELTKRCRVLIISGSIPPGFPVDCYRQMIERCRERCKVILDASGPQLKEGIQAKPTMIKPNKDELEGLCGRKLENVTEILDAAKEIVTRGVEIVCVSMGSEGALVTNGRESFFSPVIRDLVVRGTVCAGDSMVAGFAAAFIDGLNLRDSFIRAVASAGACVMQEGSAVVTKELMDQLIPRVEIQNL